MGLTGDGLRRLFWILELARPTDGWPQDAVASGMSERCGLDGQPKPGDTGAGESSGPGMEKTKRHCYQVALSLTLQMF